MRGLLTLWADEDVIDATDVGQASNRAPHGAISKRKKGRKKK